MKALVALIPAMVIEPLTGSSVDLAAAAAPLDAVQGFLLQHVRCVAGRPEAVELEPVGIGEYRGRCLHCGAERQLLAIEATGEQAIYWWLVLLAGMASEYEDVFIAQGGTFRVEVYQRCLSAFDGAIRRCVLLAQAGQAGIVH
jgi:hypothetical protein